MKEEDRIFINYMSNLMRKPTVVKGLDKLSFIRSSTNGWESLSTPETKMLRNINWRNITGEAELLPKDACVQFNPKEFSVTISCTPKYVGKSITAQIEVV